MPTFVALVGFPAVGKSRQAQQLKEKGYTIVSADEAWREIAAKYHVDSADKAYRSHREEIYMVLLQRLDAALRRGDDIVFDALNLSRKDRELPLRIVRAAPHAYTIKAMVIHPPEEDIHADRLMQRLMHEKRAVAVEGLYQSSLEAKFQQPMNDEGFHAIETVGTPPKSPLMSL